MNVKLASPPKGCVMAVRERMKVTMDNIILDDLDSVTEAKVLAALTEVELNRYNYTMFKVNT